MNGLPTLKTTRITCASRVWNLYFVDKQFSIFQKFVQSIICFRLNLTEMNFALTNETVDCLKQNKLNWVNCHTVCILTVASMLVTDVGDEICWWVWDIFKFEIFVRKPALRNKIKAVFMLKRQAVHNVYSWHPIRIDWFQLRGVYTIPAIFLGDQSQKTPCYLSW